MKRILLFGIIIFSGINSIAQFQSEKNNQRTIEVVGSASSEIEPDQVHISFTIKDYELSGKAIHVDKTEVIIKQLLDKYHINPKDFTVLNIYGYMTYEDNNKAGHYQSRKTYGLKVSDLSVVNSFIAEIDKYALESVNIDEVTHSDLSVHYKTVRKLAVSSAKQKAFDVLSGFGEKCGRVIKIEEISSNYNDRIGVQSISNYKSADSETSGIGSQKIKLSDQVRVVFEIK
jgi:uncharacterized protein YggE